jgi:hypothetical protein
MRLLGNKFKYVTYTSGIKPNQQKRKVYPQVKYHEYMISLILQGIGKCKVVKLIAT